MTTYPAHLDRFSPAIRRVVDRWPSSSVDEVLTAVGQGTAQLWDVPGHPDNVIVTRLIQEPHRLVCLVWLASGELAPLLERYEDVEAWAVAVGADAMRIQGREGWARVMPGFKRTAVVLEKELR